MNILQKIFGTARPIIGVIHLSPLLGYADFDGTEKVLQRALADAQAFERGGVSGIIVENNYDLPHSITVGPETGAIMTLVVSEISKKTHLPLGVCVLWNDYKAALAIAKVVGARFVRIPVFVDRVRTSFGDILGDPQEVRRYRKIIRAENVALFTDIQVKHAELLDIKEITLSAKQAVTARADALIVTGIWTGEAPPLQKLKEVRDAVGRFPIMIGSGCTKENILELLTFADGAIVSTSLKTGTKRPSSEERNLKPFQERIKLQKVNEFMRRVAELQEPRH